MTDWKPEREKLQAYAAHLRAAAPRLEEEITATLRQLAVDHRAVLMQARCALEIVVEELCEKGLQRPRGTEPLASVITRIGKQVPESVLPGAVLSAMEYLNKLGNLGPHPKPLSDEDVPQALGALRRVLQWYARDYRPDLGEPPAAPPGAAAQPAGLPQAAAEGKRLVILYKRRAEPDGRLLGVLESALQAAGHRVFIDRHLNPGVEWAREIESEIRAADAVIVLLSRASVNSEMMAYEVEIAATVAREHAGKPRLLPVRLAFTEPLPPELAPHLERLQYVLWQGTDDDEALFAGVIGALAEPARVPQPVYPLERDTGAVPLDSKFYVVRRVDGELEAALARRDSIVLIKGARQMGKTSLLARTIERARQQGMRIVLTDLQKLASDQFLSLDAFFRAIAEIMADQLDLDVFPDMVWRAGRSPNMNFERYLRREILEPRCEPLLWAIDEVDRLFSCPFGGDVLALFRTWHNECALDPGKPWRRLTLAIAYATEAHLFITDPNQSPFNVGTKLELADFTREQVADLNRRYGSPLREPAEFLQLYALLGGQPYLTRHALNVLIAEKLRLPDLEALADRDDGPFGDHLRRLLLMLGREPALVEAVRLVLAGKPCPDYPRFYRLRSAGILAGEGKEQARARCGLYERYLRRHLG